jgi:hypothetical protein
MTYTLPCCFSEPTSSPPLLLLFHSHCKAYSFFINLSPLQCAMSPIFCVITGSVDWLSESRRNQSAQMELCNHSFLVILTTLFHLLKIYSVEWEDEFCKMNSNRVKGREFEGQILSVE